MGAVGIWIVVKSADVVDPTGAVGIKCTVVGSAGGVVVPTVGAVGIRSLVVRSTPSILTGRSIGRFTNDWTLSLLGLSGEAVATTKKAQANKINFIFWNF